MKDDRSTGTTHTIKIENKKKKIYGHIYLATNILNNKVYVGKVKLPKTIKKRWKEHHKKGEKLKQKRLANPNKKIWGTYLNNAIAKYSPDIWYLTQIDVAYSREELNEKERYWIKKYKSNDPQYGYNMTEGGEGGTPNKESLNKIIEIVTEKWKDPEYREKIRKIRNTPEFKEKFSKSMSKATSKMWKNPIFREKVSNSIKKKWEDPEYKEKVSKKISNAIIEKWQDSQYKKKFDC